MGSIYDARMGNAEYIVRNYRPEDFDKLVRLAAEVEKLGQTWQGTSLGDLKASLVRSDFRETDLFVAEIAGDIVGFIEILPELDIGRAVLSWLVHPGHRGKGLAEKLLRCATSRAGELGARVAHVNIPQDSIGTRKLLSKMGFRFVRRFLEMELGLSKVNLPDMSQIGSKCRYLQCGEEDKLAQIQNSSFAVTWGYNPNTTEEIIYRTSLPGCSPEDIILVCDANKLVGYCWTRIEFGQSVAGNGGRGRIYMLGVDPDCWGRGMGKQVLLDGLAYLKSKGLWVAELTVDSENWAACALYRSVGFEVCATSLWYEKALD